jgi:hypothetical protein
MSWESPASIDLNFSNRRTLTRMSGGVAGESGHPLPYADFLPLENEPSSCFAKHIE